MSDDDPRPARPASFERLLELACRQPRARALWREMRQAHGGDRDAAVRAFVARAVAEPGLREGLVGLLVASFEAELVGPSDDPVRH